MHHISRRGVRAGGARATPKILICQKPGQNPFRAEKIRAQMFRDFCYHCVINESVCQNTSESDFFSFFGSHTIKRFWVTSKQKKIFIVFEIHFFGEIWGDPGKNHRTTKICQPLHLPLTKWVIWCWQAPTSLKTQCNTGLEFFQPMHRRLIPYSTHMTRVAKYAMHCHATCTRWNKLFQSAIKR